MQVRRTQNRNKNTGIQSEIDIHIAEMQNTEYKKQNTGIKIKKKK